MKKFLIVSLFASLILPSASGIEINKENFDDTFRKLKNGHDIAQEITFGSDLASNKIVELLSEKIIAKDLVSVEIKLSKTEKPTVEVFKKLSELPNLKKLVCRSKGKGRLQQINKDILAEIVNCNKLIYLDLSHQHIGSEGAKKIASTKSPLVSLLLTHNKIGGSDAEKEIAKMSTITYLDLTKNNISDTGANELAAMKGLTFLNISKNRSLTQEALSKLQMALPTTKIVAEKMKTTGKKKKN